MITAGAYVDEIENAFCNFGLILTNPIPVNGPIGEVIYLSSLRQLGKTKILFHRIGSIDGFDVFESVSVDGKTWDIFYLDMFHPRKSSGRKNALPLINLSLMCSTLFGNLELRRILEHHLVLGAAGGNHRIAVFIGIGMNIHQHRPLVL